MASHDDRDGTFSRDSAQRPPSARWQAEGHFEIEFDAPTRDVWAAWVQLTQTAGSINRYECTIRHPGDAEGLGLIRSWRFPMPFGPIGRSWEWITAIHPERSVSFEGVAAPPLAQVSGTMTLHPLNDGTRTRLQSVERYELLNRALAPLSRTIHRRITAMNARHVEREVLKLMQATDDGRTA